MTAAPAVRAVLALILGAAPSMACAQSPPNTLTPDETRAGWRLLFDGKDLAGWRGFKSPAPSAGWTVTDGVLSPDPKVSKDLVSEGVYESFELDFDWRISPQGNSGVMFHVVEQGEETYQSGPEYQILDNAHPTPPNEKAASLFALYAPARDVTKPPGEFNHGQIIVSGSHVEHWLNGVKVVAYDLGSADFAARVAASKFRRWPQFAASPAGRIALQNHGDAVGFRNIKLRVISPAS